MFRIDRINVFYGDVQVLWDISLRVGEGEIVAVIGPNGAGKSTLLRTIVNLNRPRKSGAPGEGIFYPGESNRRSLSGRDGEAWNCCCARRRQGFPGHGYSRQPEDGILPHEGKGGAGEKPGGGFYALPSSEREAVTEGKDAQRGGAPDAGPGNGAHVQP